MGLYDQMIPLILESVKSTEKVVKDLQDKHDQVIKDIDDLQLDVRQLKRSEIDIKTDLARVQGMLEAQKVVIESNFNVESDSGNIKATQNNK